MTIYQVKRWDHLFEDRIRRATHLGLDEQFVKDFLSNGPRQFYTYPGTHHEYGGAIRHEAQEEKTGVAVSRARLCRAWTIFVESLIRQNVSRAHIPLYPLRNS